MDWCILLFFSQKILQMFLTASLYKRITVLTNAILIDQDLFSSPLMPKEGNPEKATEEGILRAPASRRQNSQNTVCQTAVDV